jgi:hypothetical protein
MIAAADHSEFELAFSAILCVLCASALRFWFGTEVCRMAKQRAWIAVLAALGICAQAHAFDFPKRKSGLWEIETTSSARAGASQKAQMCIDQKSDDALNQMGTGMSKQMCSQTNVRREGAAIVSDSVCQFGTTTATTHSVVTGKFDSAYKVETKSSYDPPMSGMKQGSAVIQARWVGPCKADQKPGDMILPNGMKFNVNDPPKRQ